MAISSYFEWAVKSFLALVMAGRDDIGAIYRWGNASYVVSLVFILIGFTQNLMVCSVPKGVIVLGSRPRHSVFGCWFRPTHCTWSTNHLMFGHPLLLITTFVPISFSVSIVHPCTLSACYFFPARLVDIADPHCLGLILTLTLNKPVLICKVTLAQTPCNFSQKLPHLQLRFLGK